ncbi:hypothetical protein KQM40_003732 [Escherichia coli]|nr:hypothetical protein [Escherichia coli]
MSVINEFKNPINGKVDYFAKGFIKYVNIRPVKNADADGIRRTHIPARNGQPAKVIEATHSISFLMQEVDDNNNVIDPQSQGEWISMGEKKLHPSHADKIQVKFDSGYKDIVAGMVVSFPLKITKSGDKTYTNGTLNGKTFSILDESKVGQSAPRQQSSTQSPANAQVKGTKIYGEIAAIVGNVVTVNDEKNGQGNLVLTDEQLAQVVVGGRVTAIVNLSDGTVLSGFKAYGPAGQTKKSSGGYDALGVACGHGINGVKELIKAGFKIEDRLSAAKMVHNATVAMKAFVAEKTGKDVESNAVGASAGNAILVACALYHQTDKLTEDSILNAAKDVYLTLSEPFYEFLSKGDGKTQQKNKQHAKEPLNSSNSDIPNMESPAPEFDYDEDIPFSPVGLQYGKHRVYIL